MKATEPHPAVLPAVAGVLATLLWPAPAAAGHPFATDDAGTVDRGALELELASAALAWRVPGAPDLGSALALHAGLAHTVDAGVGFTYGVARRDGAWTAAMERPALDLKWRLRGPDGPVPGLALRLDYAAPHRLGAVRTGHDLGALAILSWELEWLAIHVDAGVYAHAMAANDAHVSGYAALALLGQVTAELLLGVEAVVDGFPHVPHSASALGGLVWQPDPVHALSLGAGPVWSEDDAFGWMATAGFTATFGQS